VKARQKYRSVIFFKDYFEKFFVRQSKKVKDKIIWTIELIEEIKKVPETYLLATTDGLFEIRVKSGRDIFRIFCFFDKGDLIVLMNGFQKKTQRTPRSEIRKALEIKKEYEHEQ
jgi:phage-related protein